MDDISNFATSALVDEINLRGSLLDWVTNTDLIDEISARCLESEFSGSIRDYSTNDLIDEIESRGLTVSDHDSSPAYDIVQKHRCGQEWQTAALEYLYGQANKVI